MLLLIFNNKNTNSYNNFTIMFNAEKISYSMRFKVIITAKHLFINHINNIGNIYIRFRKVMEYILLLIQ